MLPMRANLDQLLAAEDHYIAQLVAQQLYLFDKASPALTEAKVNALLALPGAENIAGVAHRAFMGGVVRAFLQHHLSPISTAVEALVGGPEEAAAIDLPSLLFAVGPDELEQLHVAYLNSTFHLSQGKVIRQKSKLFLKETGAVYTCPDTCYAIVSDTISRAVATGISPQALQCLDFAAGTGRFYFAAAAFLQAEYGLSLQHIAIHILAAVDLDATALLVLKCRLAAMLYAQGSVPTVDCFINIVAKNALLVNNGLEDNPLALCLERDFGGLVARRGFDAVFSNPPYCLLKANAKGTDPHLSHHHARQQARVQREINFYRHSGFYHYAVEGMLNYYQLAIEMMLRLVRPQGHLGIICPSSLFADLTAAKLRQHLLTRHRVLSIQYFPESSRLFDDVAQATVVFQVQTQMPTTDIVLRLPRQEAFSVELAAIRRVFGQKLEVPFIGPLGWGILAKLAAHRKLGAVPFLRNRRGELDLTLFKSYITPTNTGWQLVRGNMLGSQGIVRPQVEFVEAESFLLKKSADYRVHDFGRARLVCQQVSNQETAHRLRFVFCEAHDVLANSCNYLTSTRRPADLLILQRLLNSALLNWRFKVTSSNNHINNYELDELPLLDWENLDLGQLSGDATADEATICAWYGLDEAETTYILAASTPPAKARKREPQAV